MQSLSTGRSSLRYTFISGKEHPLNQDKFAEPFRAQFISFLIGFLHLEVYPGFVNRSIGTGKTAVDENTGSGGKCSDGAYTGLYPELNVRLCLCNYGTESGEDGDEVGVAKDTKDCEAIVRHWSNLFRISY